MNYKIGDIIEFRGEIYRITANGDKDGTFDIVRHPDEMSGDRWRNVYPAEILNITSKL